MAPALKDQLDETVVGAIADNLSEAAESCRVPFDRAGFIADCVDGLGDLELTPRAAHIAQAMRAHLPEAAAAALDVVRTAIASLPAAPVDDKGEPAADVGWGESIWFFLPHSTFIAGLAAQGFGEAPPEFDLVMESQLELTQRFTAEFSIRPYVERFPDRTLDRLDRWAEHASAHVRRLVSEGTRSRLPWAGRLRTVQADPTAVVALLERLKDDPSEYVRRSVANNLNDIAKDHPEVVVEVAARWWADGDTKRRRLVRHALRTLVKAGDAAALGVMGFDASSPAQVGSLTVAPETVAIGERVRIELEIEHPTGAGQIGEAGALVDLAIDFVKANGTTSAKVFKGAERWLAPGETATIRKTVSLAQHSTRTHYPGTHTVRVLLNGLEVADASFELRD